MQINDIILHTNKHTSTYVLFTLSIMEGKAKENNWNSNSNCQHMNLLTSLPDSLWLSILLEWIGKSTTLCVFEAALCNQLLRQRYLNWLHEFGDVIANNIHFESFYKDANRDRSVPDIAFDWLEKRGIYPKSISIFFEPNHWTSNLEWNKKTSKQLSMARKNVELLTIYSNPRSIISISSDLLNNYPKLKHLNVATQYLDLTVPSVLDFNYEHGPYSLISLELKYVGFPFSNKKFEQFVEQCPLLQKVKFERCGGLNLSHIQYIIHHSKHMTSIYAAFYSSYDLKVLPGITNKAEEESQSLNISMRSLTLLDADKHLERDIALAKICTLCQVCPKIEEININLKDDEFIPPSLIHNWCNMIATSWQHLQSLTLNASYLQQSNSLVMDTIGKCCGNTLKKLNVKNGELSETFLANICCTFNSLEELKLDSIQTIAFSSFVNHFRDTLLLLHLFFLPPRRALSEPEAAVSDFAEILDCFSALKGVNLCLTNNSTFQTPGFVVNQLEEAVFDYISLTTKVLCTTPSFLQMFVKLKKLTLESFPMTQEMINSILTLPCLQVLTLVDIRKEVIDNDELFSLFYPENYPSLNDKCTLSPLKEFYCKSYIGIYFNEMMIRAFLERFPSLTFFQVNKIFVENTKFRQLQMEYCYRTMICEYDDNTIA